MASTWHAISLVLLLAACIVLARAWSAGTEGIAVLASILFGLLAIINSFMAWAQNPDIVRNDKKWEGWLETPEPDRARVLAIAAIVFAIIFPIIGPIFGLLLLRLHSNERRIVRVARIVCIVVIVLTVLVYSLLWNP